MTKEAEAAKTLPIYDHTDELISTIRDNQVVVVEGPAGTGKTTQLPRMLRAAGLSKTCVGITQPRRIAAVSVAWRIAAEEGVPVGADVGYAIRFDDCTSGQTRIKVMTDGILLQEVRGDPELSAYDVIMVDEAHERSLNIDFVLGLLHRVLVRRGDLRVVVSSATLHPGQFQQFFDDIAGPVPRVVIRNRVHPVKTRYEPVHGNPALNVPDVIARHVQGLIRKGEPGHILAFLPGEALIKRTETALLAQLRGCSDVVVLPLYGRLKRAEQERVFDDFGGKRKVVLATNIAETSITIPGVNFVIDSGLEKVPWYSTATCVTSLRESLASQASLEQRAGRAGRTGPGSVLRLYSRTSFEERERFTPEEIMRVDLSEAVLRLIDLGVYDVEYFPFPTRPPRRKLFAALDALFAMGAIDRERHLTDIGKRMVPFPLSPALSRMVVEAADRFPRAVSDVLLAGAFLSVRSPFLFPPDHETQARAAHNKLQREWGDAATAVHTFRAWSRSANKKNFCDRNYLDADTMTFIAKAHEQLCDIAAEHGVSARGLEREQADPTELVRCVAAGFADRLLLRRGGGYVSLGDVRVAIHPSSACYGTQHRVVVAAELMQAGRVYAFNVSPLKVEWISEVNPDAAARWGLRRSGPKTVTPAPTAPSIPHSIDIGDISLPVVRVGSKGRVDISVDQAKALRAAAPSPAALAPHVAQMKARVLTEGGPLLRGPLSRVLALVRVVPMPDAGDANADKNVPVGALLELDRNLHTVGRFLDRLLLPAFGRKRPGWLVLVSNGGGGFWFDVVTDYPEAISLCTLALEHLRDAGAVAEALQDDVEAWLTKLEQLQADVDDALGSEA